MKVPYDFIGTVEYQKYDDIIARVDKFDDFLIIGRDASGEYDMYAIRLGNKSKPSLLITGGMHGTEWQGTQYSLAFMEQLRDNTFPDKDFRDFLLNNFYIIYIPVVNPWGLDNTTPHAQVIGRRNSNNADLNRDFSDFTQAESQNVKSVMDKYKPFAYLDLHLIRSPEELIIVGNGQSATNDVRDLWADSWEEYLGKSVTRWAGYENLNPGLSRRYMRDQVNNYTPYTLSYITEIARPTEEDNGFVAPLSDEEIYKVGMSSIYLFFKTSIQYYMENFKTPEYENQLMYVRDLKGNEYHLQATVTHDLELNGNQSLSFTVLPTKANRKFIGDLSEMWEVIDDKGVVHRIVYCKQKGKGNLEYNYTPEQKESFLSPVQATQAIEKKRELVKNMTVEVKAIPKFFDDMDNSRIYEEYNEHMPAKRAFSRIFDGMPYKFIIVGQFDAVEWEGFGAGESRLETFKRALNRYKMEFRIEGNIVYLEHQIGRDTQFQYRYRLNASNIVKEIDAGEFWTYARGYGDYEGGEDEGWEHANIQMDYTSPLAKIVGKREAPPIKDGRIKKKSTMEQSLKELVDESLMISISTDIHDLRKQGYALAQPEVGDRVFIVDERIGLDEEIRITDISVTKDWKGNVIDLKLTVGSGNLSKRHQSNLNTAAKELSDVLSGKKTFPYSVLDEAVKNATEVLQNVQTELDFSGSGIIGRDKDNPNYLTLFSGRGIGVSDDGGNSFTEAIIAGKGINASAVVTGTMVADFIAGGTLASLNGNLEFDMNKGNFDMKNAHFTLGGGALIDFTSAGNGIRYRRYDEEDGYSRIAGFGVGRSTNDRYPITYIGTTGGPDQDTLDPSWTGFIANTNARIANEDSANAIYGQRARFVSNTEYDKGLTIDFYKNEVLVPWGASFDLGDSGSRFNKVYADEMRGSKNILLRDAYGSGGLLFATDWDGNPNADTTNLGIYPLNSGTYEYNLGTGSSPFTYATIKSIFADYINGTVVGTSTHNSKMNIEDVDGERAFDYFNIMKVKSFYYKNGDITDPYERKVSPIIEQLDPTIENLYKATDEALDINSNLFLLAAAFQHHIKMTDERFKTLEAQINE